MRSKDEYLQKGNHIKIIELYWTLRSLGLTFSVSTLPSRDGEDDEGRDRPSSPHPRHGERRWEPRLAPPPLRAQLGRTLLRGGHNVFFSKFEYVTGWMPLYNQFQDLFRKKIKF